MNEHDSEKMAAVLAAEGLRPAPADTDADVILLNTCAVREKASQKVFARLGVLKRLKVRRPNLIIGVCGCVAQMEKETIFKRAPHVDFVLGPRHVASLWRFVEQARRQKHQIAVFDPRDRIVPETPQAALRSFRARAYITVMEGCNKGCTFCIVPVTRGRESCRQPDAILDEAGRAALDGCPEIELLGQNVNAYRCSGWDFTRLLAAAGRVPGIRRVRFVTSHPLHFKNSIADVMAANPTICPSLHLPVQSGSNAILSRMRRGYTREEYLAKAAYVRSRVEGLALSTDIIVGFPGETEADFAHTLDLVRLLRYDQLYAFVFSPRPGTPAAVFEDDVPAGEKSERLRRLMGVQERIQREINDGYVGRILDVLVEGPSVMDPGELAGRTTANKVVNFSGPAEWTATFKRVRIVHAGPNSLRGEAMATSRDGAALTSLRARDIYVASSVPAGGSAP